MRPALALLLTLACAREQTQTHTEVIAAPPAPVAAPVDTANDPVGPSKPHHKKHAAKADDRDGDGIADHLDKCPDDPEDLDGFEDADGCPDPDNDQDGVPDPNDKCPNEPGPPSKGGCP